MTMEDIRKFVWCGNKHESHFTLINMDKYDPHRKKSIGFKVEQALWINRQQILIKEY